MIYEEVLDIPGNDEDRVWRGQAYKDTIGRSFHLRTTKDENRQKVSHQAQNSHQTEHQAGDDQLKNRIIS